MINKPSPSKGLDISIPMIIPIKGRGFINQGSGLGVTAMKRGTEYIADGRLGTSTIRCLRVVAWLHALGLFCSVPQLPKPWIHKRPPLYRGHNRGANC